MSDTIEITEIGNTPLAYPVVCEIEQHEAGCALWCREFGQWAEGLTVSHAKEKMLAKLAGSLRTNPAVRGTLLLRLSDNVLDPPEWPVLRVKLEHGKIVSRNFSNRGVYDRSGFPDTGDGLPVVSEWLSHDDTGFHPENYYEVFDPRDGKWRSFVGSHELDAISQVEVTPKQWHEITKSFYHRP